MQITTIIWNIIDKKKKKVFIVLKNKKLKTFKISP